MQKIKKKLILKSKTNLFYVNCITLLTASSEDMEGCRETNKADKSVLILSLSIITWRKKKKFFSINNILLNSKLQK